MKAYTDWRLLTLEEAGVELFDCEHKTPPAAREGIPYIAIPEMKGGRLDVSKARLVASHDVPTWNRRITPQEGDVILSRRTNPGVTAIVPANFPCVLGQNLVILRSRGTAVDQKFLRWLVRAPEWWQQIEKNLNVGAVFDSLRCADIPRFELTIPPLPEQRAIAHILGTLDDKIELNRRMNETREAIARGLFQSWFVDFDPVRAKAEGRPTGLPPEIDALFPDAFEETEIGEVPRGWGVGPISSLLQINPRCEIAKGTEAPYVEMADLPTTGPIVRSRRNRPASSGSRFVNGDTLLARLTPCLENGKAGLVGFLPSGGGAWGSTEFLVFRPVRKLPSVLAYLYIRWDELKAHAIANMSGSSGRQRVPASCFDHFPISIAPDALYKYFGRMIQPLFDRMEVAADESEVLGSLRDALLPRLISGEMRLSIAKEVGV